MRETSVHSLHRINSSKDSFLAEWRTIVVQIICRLCTYILHWKNFPSPRKSLCYEGGDLSNIRDRHSKQRLRMQIRGLLQPGLEKFRGG